MVKFRPIHALLVLLVAALIGPGVPIAQAQQNPVTVRAELPQQMYLGDSVDLYIAVTGSRNVEPPDLSGLKDFEAVYRAPQDSSSTMTTIVNGRISTKVSINFSHLYLLTPKRVGTLEFPALTVVVDGHSYTTAPVQVIVTEPKAAPDFKLTVSTEPAEAFVGQPITVRLVWQLGTNVKNATFSLPILGPEHETMAGPQTSQVSGNERAGVVQIRLNGQPVFALLQGSTLTVDRTFIPSKPGTLTVGPARADFLTIIGQRERQPFDSFFEDRSITERQFSSAPQINIPVRDLPAAGRPANFSGLVGNYAINASVDSSNVSVGDPITLSVGVTGPYPLTSVPALDLARQSSLKGPFRIPREPVLPQVSGGTAAFSAMIRARSADVHEIGPLTLNYFDPISKTYKVAATAPIPLTVRASTSITLPDEPEDAAPPPTPERRPGGFPDIERASSHIPGDTFDISQKMQAPGTWAILLTPPAVCLLAAGTIGIRRWTHRDPAARRRRAAFRQFRRDLHQAQSSGATLDPIARALHNFAADFFDEPRDTLTATHAASLLTSHASAAGAELATLLRECDESRFGVAGSRPVDRAAISRRALTAARNFTSDVARRVPNSDRRAA